jgi:hypothetical protein
MKKSVDEITLSKLIVWLGIENPFHILLEGAKDLVLHV